jgi:hypothetical protein
MNILQTTTCRKPMNPGYLRTGKGGYPPGKNSLKLVEHEEGPSDKAAKGSKVIPMQLVAKIKG